jgi:RNA polymerase primary sigma factor
MPEQDNHYFYSQYKSILQTLTEREAKVIASRFGVGDIDPQTLEQIGMVMGVTRERVRQIERSKSVKKNAA